MSAVSLSLRSKARLLSCHPELQRIVTYAEAWMPFPFQVLEGHRSRERQMRLFQQGRSQINGRWEVTVPERVITHCDGYTRISKHNIEPSQAVNLAPYPADWKDRDRFHVMAGIVLAASAYLRVPVRWGTEEEGGQHDEPPVELLGHFHLNRPTF